MLVSTIINRGHYLAFFNRKKDGMVGCLLSFEPPVVFIDEIHRFNKAQQDALLGAVEAGEITLIGATTENPSFSVNNALLSRCQVYRLEPLNEEQIASVLSLLRCSRI